MVIANARIPSERAHPLQIMHMAGAFAGKVNHVTLAYARRANTAAMNAITNPFEYAGVTQTFNLIGLPCIDAVKRVTIDWPALNRAPVRIGAHLLQLWTFTIAAALMIKRWDPDIVISRDLLPLTILRMLVGRTTRFGFEAHTVPQSRLSIALHRWAARRMDGIVTITEGLRQWYVETGFDPARVLTAADAVDLASFNQNSRSDARRDLNIRFEAPVACYIGHLYPWKGVDILVAAARATDPKVQWYIVGGLEPDLDRIRKSAAGHPNIHITGHLSPALARQYLIASDVAVLPFTAHETIARDHTSPLKLFEYMAAERPIVASNLPSLREVLRDGENAILVTPDDPEMLGAAVTRVLNDQNLAHRLARTARAEVEKRTWSNRAGLILEFLQSSRPE